MKQFVFGFCAVLVFTVGSVRAASAQDWWWHTGPGAMGAGDRKSTRLNSSHTVISYAVFCLKKKTDRLHLPHGVAREPDRLRAPSAPHAQSWRARNTQHARPSEAQAGPLPARLDLRGLRRAA